MAEDDDDLIPAKIKQTPRKTSTPKRNNATTPIRKTSAQNRTPNSAPVVRKNTSGKKGEPTLFQDFLLGRPSPARTGTGKKGVGAQRRKSLDGVKRELRLGEEEVGKLQSPGGVKDRVMQWQKTSGSPVVTKTPDKNKDIGDEGPDGKLRIRDSQKRPGRRKSKEAEDLGAAKIAAKVAVGRQRSKSAAAPKRRVISDDHWMKKVPAKTTELKQGRPIPKNFLEKTAANPPVERKIDDWMKRTASEGPEEGSPRVSKRNTPEDTPTRRKVSRQSPRDDADSEEIPRRRKALRRDSPDEEIRVRSSPDDGIRVGPSSDPDDDRIRVKPSRDNSFNAGDDSIRIKPIRKERRPKEEDPVEFRTPRKRSEKHLRPPEPESNYGLGSQNDDEGTSSWVTASRTESKRRPRKSGSPTETLSDIPFGNSAFSILDLPVGAEAGTMRRPMPKRNPSFTMPKVLKKVYTEGMKIVHDTVDPPRVGVNQPPSIESWLNGTTDPFVDRPAAPASNLDVPEPPSRMRSYKEDDRTERDLMEDADSERSRRKRRVQSSQEAEKASGGDSPSSNKARETLPSMETSSPISPTGLRRTPATRITSSPKSARKLPLKEALLDAFRGESTTYRPKGNPLADLSSFRENRSPPEFKIQDDDYEPISKDDTPKPSPPVPRHTVSEESTREKDKPLPAFPRRQAPTTGEHRLSTIASVETFSTHSSVTETESELSQTTVTQLTASTAPTASSLSHNSNKPGLKRRLTKHSDLLSVLSLPDSGAPGRAKSIRSARSVRTNRRHLDNATIQDLMKELADDETKYMRELKTLVDGVIPVLLTCVLSKSDSAVAAGLFDTDSTESLDASFTKPIVDMGIALERLRSLHNRVPLSDPKAFVTWLQGALKSYDDYLTAWRMGFQDVVVNLAPASRTSSADQSPTLDEIPRNANGDLVGSNGERVDVAFLLKRPLVRIKYLLKIMMGIQKNLPSEHYEYVMASLEKLQERVRKRVKEEQARLEDRAANNIDTTRARDPQTLALAEDVKIDRTRQVHFKDDFSLDLKHSTGQRLEFHVELILRDKPSDKNDEGDVLIVATNVDEVKKWLLFPPILKHHISGREGDKVGEAVIMIRDNARNWDEVFLLKTSDHDAITDLIECVGSSPLPPPIAKDDASVISKLTESRLGSVGAGGKTLVADLEVPIGERSRRDAEAAVAARKERRPASGLASKPTVITEESVVSGVDPKDLNEAMIKAGSPKFTANKHARARYHSREASQTTSPGGYNDGQSSLPADYDCVFEDRRRRKNITKHYYFMSGGLAPPEEKKPGSPSSLPRTPKLSTPLKESMKPGPEVLKKQSPTTPTMPRDDGAPPPPAHRVPTTPNTLKKAVPVLDSPTPQAKHRRTSSPLKHEYQPSIASDTSSSSEASDSDRDTYSDESSDDDLEAPELPEPPVPALFPRQKSPPVSLYNLPNASVAPSNSASQSPYRSAPTQKVGAKTMVASISSWNNDLGRWEDLHEGVCSIVVSPGCIAAYEMNANHSSPRRGQGFGKPDLEPHAADEMRPLIEQELTPHVNLRQSVGVDLQISVRPTENSIIKLRKDTKVIRYRTVTERDNMELYSLVHYSRMNNPYFIQLEQDRILQSYGTKTYENAVASNRRRSFFGRKNSYRASERAPSSSPSDDRSLSSSTVSRLRRLSGGIFNIPKSTLLTSQPPTSQYGSSSNSTFSGVTPPRTPTSPSLAGTMTSSGNPVVLGNENIKIRLHHLETKSRWDDRGSARISITIPPPHMRPRSTINQGITRRVVVTQELKNKPFSSSKEEKQIITVIDDVLGADCFTRIGRSGVLCVIWDEVRGDNGEVGTVGKEGGLSGRTRKWCFQCADVRSAEWIFGLCSVR